ncbi:MAG: hypothetical protein ABSG51_02075 [Terracidiphilus sp.]|jgi:hypothetical protein
MEISPIAGVRAMPVMRTPPSDTDLPAVFDIENSAKTDDETYTPSDGRQGSAAEDEEPEEELSAEPDLEEPESQGRPMQAKTGRQISFFA